MPAAAAPSILVVDDSDEDLFLFKRLLRLAGVTIHCQAVSDVPTAMKLLSVVTGPGSTEPRPQVCFVDIKMPGLNGFDLLQWVRQQPALAAMPVIMLSSSDHPFDLKRASELKAQGYLTKYPATKTLATVIADAARFPDDPRALERPYNLLAGAGAAGREEKTVY